MFEGVTAAFPPLLVWGLFVRALGLVYFITFASLCIEVVPISGERGIAPVRTRLGVLTEHFPGVRRFFYFPTLLWLSSRDWALRGIAFIGALAAALVVCGGPWTPFALITCYVAYLSLDVAIRLIFPWDCTLFETGFFAMFLPATLALPELGAVSTPDPALVWVYRLLVFRVLFGFGKFKFLGSSRDDSGYLRSFMLNQPLPSPVGWAMHALPLWASKATLIFMFFVEIPLPFFVFVPGDASIIAAAGITALMIGIQLCGSFGFFNWIIGALCITLLDTTTAWQLSLGSYFGAGEPNFLRALVLVHTFGALLAFPLNSYCSQQWLYWPWVGQLRPKFLTWPWKFFRALHPLRWLHAYGVFPPKSAAPVKCVVVFEVSWDGEDWQECHFKYCPSQMNSRPRFAAPHHPRGDQAMIYETFGIGDGGVCVHGIIGTSYVHGFNELPLAAGIAQRVLEGSPGIPHFLQYKAAADGSPPRFIRAQTYMLERTSFAALKQNGRWWKRTYIGPHLPVTTLREDFDESTFPEPELWHWEQMVWVKRSRLKPLLERAVRGESADALLLEDARGLSAGDVRRFWDEFLPRIARIDRDDWSRFAELMSALREQYSAKQLRQFARVHGRLSYLLLARFEPHFEGSLFHPRIPVKNYFALGMLTSDIIARGKAVYDRAYSDPLSAVPLAEGLTIARGLFLMGVFRYEAMVFEAQKLRLLQAIMEPSGRRTTSGEQKLEKTLETIGEHAFAIAALTPFLREQFKGPAYERGYPERYPKFEVLPSAAVVRIKDAAESSGRVPAVTGA
jgi:hypothetical protein